MLLRISKETGFMSGLTADCKFAGQKVSTGSTTEIFIACLCVGQSLNF